MSDYLFTVWGGGGSVPPVLDVAGALVRRGHRVRAIGDPVLRDEVEAAGVEHRDWVRAPHRTSRAPGDDLLRDWEARTPMGGFARLRDRVMFGPAAAYAQDVLEELDRRPADVVVTEVAIPGPLLAAELEALAPAREPVPH